MVKTTVVATGTAAFGATWELGVDEDGQWAIVREIGVKRNNWPAGIRRQYFDNEADARAYFTQYTTPIVAVEAR